MGPAYNDTVFLPLDIIADTLSCSVCLCDGENSGENRMIKSCPHVVIERYPENSANKTKEEALAHLKEQLVTAYEEKYGSFTTLDEKADGAYDEQEDLRYRISKSKLIFTEHISLYFFLQRKFKYPHFSEKFSRTNNVPPHSSCTKVML